MDCYFYSGNSYILDFIWFMKKFLNKDGREFFSKNSNTIIFVIFIIITYLFFGVDEENILMDFLKYFTDILNIF